MSLYVEEQFNLWEIESSGMGLRLYRTGEAGPVELS